MSSPKMENANELALQAESSTKAKSKFLSNVRHEIRTPPLPNINFSLNASLLLIQVPQNQTKAQDLVKVSVRELYRSFGEIDFSSIENQGSIFTIKVLFLKKPR